MQQINHCKKEVKKTKELHTGEYNSIMEIFRYNPVTYCYECGAKKYSSYCKCNRLPIKIGKAKLIDINFKYLIKINLISWNIFAKLFIKKPVSNYFQLFVM